LWYIVILSVVGTGLALMLFNALVKIASPVFASSVTYLIPIVAVIWGIADGESLPWTAFIWILVILTGVFLVNKKVLYKKSL
jgi:drug/metabolite transporter (DMT)-like permease